MNHDPLRNPKDPLRKAGPNQQQELFRQFAALAKQFPLEDVIGACMNLLVNAIRQGSPTLAGAVDRYSHWTGRFRQILNDHYDSITGRRRSIFPFDQTIQMDHFDARDKFKQ